MLSKEEIKKLENKIFAAEQMTSAEFKIVVCKRAWLGISKKAISIFKKFHLDKTQDRNAVLFLIIEKDKQLLIYGDKGIHEKTGISHWENIKNKVIDDFKNNDYYGGISVGIHLIAKSLADHYPANQNNKNEISNAIIFE